MLYSVTAGFLALVIFFIQIKKGWTSGVWAYVLVICSFIIGSAPLIGGILPGLLNWAVNLVTNMVFGQSVQISGGAYSVTVVVGCIAALIAILWDGKVTNFEKWVLVVCGFVIGSTPLVTSWLPTGADGIVGGVTGMM